MILFCYTNIVIGQSPTHEDISSDKNAIYGNIGFVGYATAAGYYERTGVSWPEVIYLGFGCSSIL